MPFLIIHKKITTITLTKQVAEFYQGNFSGPHDNCELKLHVHSLKQGPSAGTLKVMTPDLRPRNQGQEIRIP